MMFFKSNNKDDNGLLRNIGIYILLNAAILLVFALAIRIYYMSIIQKIWLLKNIITYLYQILTPLRRIFTG